MYAGFSEIHTKSVSRIVDVSNEIEPANLRAVCSQASSAFRCGRQTSDFAPTCFGGPCDVDNISVV